MNLTPSEMVEKLLDRLHRRPSGEDILDWLNSAQDYIASLRDDWRFLHDLDNDITTENGVNDYNLPADFAWPMNFRDVTNDRKLTPKTLAWLYRQDPTPTATSTPSYYILLGPTGTNDDGDVVQQVRFWRIPAGEYTITHDYYKNLPDLTTDTDVPSLIPDHQLLMDMAQIRGKIAGEEDDDKLWIPEVEKNLGPRIQALMRRETYNPDKNTGMKKDRRITAQAFGGRIG